LSALVGRGGVGRKGTTGAEGFDVESSVLSVLGCKIRAQSNLLVCLDDFLEASVELLKDVVAFGDAFYDALEEDRLSFVVGVFHLAIAGESSPSAGIMYRTGRTEAGEITGER